MMRSNQPIMQAINEFDLEALKEELAEVKKGFAEIGFSDYKVLFLFVASSRNPEMVRLVLEKAADLDCLTYKDLVGSYKAIANQCLEFVKNFSSVTNSEVDERACTLLTTVANDMLTITSNGLTDLYDAIRKGDVERLKLLIKNPNIHSVECTHDGLTLLDFALESGNVEIIKTVWGFAHTAIYLEVGETPLHFLVRQENVSIDNVTDFLLSDDVDVNAGQNNRYTALHIAVEKGDLNVVRVLMQAGANIGARDSDSVTPLHLAARCGHKDIVEALLSEADDKTLNATDLKSRTALHLAAGKGRADIVAMLLLKGAKAHATDAYSRTPAQYAIFKGKQNIANQINESIFWKAYNIKYQSETLKTTNLPADAKIADILVHAAKDDNRTREVCIDLDWVDGYGKPKQVKNSSFEYATRCHAAFWSNQAGRFYDGFTRTNLPKDATLEEIFYHAKHNEKSRTRDICVEEGWMDDNGCLTERAPQIKYETAEQCLAAFLNLHKKKMQRQWFKSTSLPEDATLAGVLEHAASKDNRSRLVCMTLGWLDADGGLMIDAPKFVRDAYPADNLRVSLSFSACDDSI